MKSTNGNGSEAKPVKKHKLKSLVSGETLAPTGDAKGLRIISKQQKPAGSTKFTSLSPQKAGSNFLTTRSLAAVKLELLEEEKLLSNRRSLTEGLGKNLFSSASSDATKEKLLRKRKRDEAFVGPRRIPLDSSVPERNIVERVSRPDTGQPQLLNDTSKDSDVFTSSEITAATNGSKTHIRGVSINNTDRISPLSEPEYMWAKLQRLENGEFYLVNRKIWNGNYRSAATHGFFTSYFKHSSKARKGRCKEPLTSHKALESSDRPVEDSTKGELSLFEQLFPEDAIKRPGSSQSDLARLPPPDLEIWQVYPDDVRVQDQLQSKFKARGASLDAFREEETTILVLSRASPALSEADFRLVVPKGEHIEDWRGPGELLKGYLVPTTEHIIRVITCIHLVIPARHIETLEPLNHYYLLFPNYAHARAYQDHVIRLHRLAQTYNPASLDFVKVTAPKIMDDSSQDADALLQDFALSPPSVRFTLRKLEKPYKSSLSPILRTFGYKPLGEPENMAGRAVLFWVDGYQPSTFSIKTMLAKDGQDRGLQWGPLRGDGAINVLNVDKVEIETDDDEEESANSTQPERADRRGRRDGYDELTPKRRIYQRWVISFEDEAEARRFVRVWHRQPYSFPLETESRSFGDPDPLVHAEFMW